MLQKRRPTEHDAKIIVCGALQDKFSISAAVLRDVYYKHSDIERGDYLLAYHTQDLKYCVKVFRDKGMNFYIYDDFNVEHAARTFILIVGAEEAIKSVATAVKVYNKCRK